MLSIAGSRGFLEWTGIWAGLLTVVLAVGAGGSWIIARLRRIAPPAVSQPFCLAPLRLQLEPEVAGQLPAPEKGKGARRRGALQILLAFSLDFLKPLLNVYQLLFLARARAHQGPEAATCSHFSHTVSVSQVLLAQFPKARRGRPRASAQPSALCTRCENACRACRLPWRQLKTTDWPYAIVHYPTEFVLDPTRAAQKNARWR